MSEKERDEAACDSREVTIKLERLVQTMSRSLYGHVETVRWGLE